MLHIDEKRRTTLVSAGFSVPAVLELAYPNPSYHLKPTLVDLSNHRAFHIMLNELKIG